MVFKFFFQLKTFCNSGHLKLLQSSFHKSKKTSDVIGNLSSELFRVHGKMRVNFNIFGRYRFTITCLLTKLSYKHLFPSLLILQLFLKCSFFTSLR